MSRIYDNQPLRNLPLIHIDYPGTWGHDKLKQGAKEGVLLEGIIQGRSHFAVTDSTKTKLRYYIFHIKVSRAHRRKFDGSGKEIEPNFSETKKVSTGYLNSSYKVEAKGKTDLLSLDEALSMVREAELTMHTTKHAPQGCASLWLRGDKCEGIEFENGDRVRVKTDGNGPFIFSIAKLDEQTTTVSNYTGGEAVGATWTDKIMDVKSSQSQKSSQENEGVDEDEWDD